MKLLPFLLRVSWKRSVLIIITGFLGGLSAAGLLALIDTVIRTNGFDSQTLIWSFIGLGFTLVSMRMVSNLVLVRMSHQMIFELRMHLSRRFLSVPLQQLEEIGTHRLLAALTDDIEAITHLFLSIPLLCIHLTTVIVCLLYLGWLSWIMLVAVLGFVILGSLSYQLLASRAYHYFKFGREAQDKLFYHFRALTEGTKELKLHARRRQTFLTQVLKPTATSLRHHFVAGLTLYNAAESWGQLMFFACMGMLMFAIPAFSLVKSAVIIGGTLVVLYIMTPLDGIMSILPSIGRASVALQKIETLGVTFDQYTVEEDSVEVSNVPCFRDELQLIDICHTYRHDGDEQPFKIGPIDLVIRPGLLIFLIGGNGSGKTTFAKILTGLYSPERGDIRIDGQKIDTSNRDWYRQYFTAIFSDFFVFDWVFGICDEYSEELAQHYLSQLQLDHKVTLKDGMLSTTMLSQGQRKRLALLTAYLEDRPIYVFDEWAADQDPIFKDVFYRQILPALKQRGKTILVITHDEKYFHLADRILKLDYGKIVDDFDVRLSNRGGKEGV